MEHHSKNIIIYGAGAAGKAIGKVLTNSSNWTVKAFVDDDVHLVGQNHYGFEVRDAKLLGELINSLCAGVIVLAIPSINHDRFFAIANEVKKFDCKLLPLARLGELFATSSDLGVQNFGRIPPEYFLNLRSERIRNHTSKALLEGGKFLVTGAGGTIGSEIVCQLLQIPNTKVVCLDHSEFALYNLNEKVKPFIEANRNNEVNMVLGDASDEVLLEKVFKQYSPKFVLHAAAYKHVSLVEQNVSVGFTNNVFSTLNLVKAASDFAANFLLISSDKAVRPTNVMGATKRVAELVTFSSYYAQSIMSSPKVVRFGNVIGSSGSVYHKFYNQILNGGPVTLSDAKASRYFMAVSEAVDLVLSVLLLPEKGLYVLDMGHPVKIQELAENMIETVSALDATCQTFDPTKRPEVVITGLQKGEKLSEELSLDANMTSSEIDGVYRLNESTDQQIGQCCLAELQSMDRKNVTDNQVIEFIKRHVEAFSHDEF